MAITGGTTALANLASQIPGQHPDSGFTMITRYFDKLIQNLTLLSPRGFTIAISDSFDIFLNTFESHVASLLR